MLRSSEIKPLFVDLSLSDKSFSFLCIPHSRYLHAAHTADFLTLSPEACCCLHITLFFYYFLVQSLSTKHLVQSLSTNIIIITDRIHTHPFWDMYDVWCMYVCIYLCMYLCMYLSMYVSMYLCMYVYMYISVWRQISINAVTSDINPIH